MTQSKKIRVAVLYGGRSGEHEVSLQSATNIIKYLDRSLYEVVPIGIDKQGVWFLDDDSLALPDDGLISLTNDNEHMLFNPELLNIHCQKSLRANLPLVKANSGERLFDVVFSTLHGTFGEDGTMQGLLELASIPYIGCGVLASAIGMDKDISKRLVEHGGIAVAPYVVIKAGEWSQQSAAIINKISANIKFPVFVKPANTGSSVGIKKIKTVDDLPAAITSALLFDTKVLVEQGIDAIELEISVLESAEIGAEPIVSVVGEVRPTHEFYSYEAKYLDANGAELLIPATITPEQSNYAQTMAKQIFKILECEGMARVDLFLERKTAKIYFNEVNTLPGFTQISMYPKMLAASGIPYQELLTKLISLAMVRHERREKLQRVLVN
jgi:D-alanine-D-alanine ligase